ncbi:MAG: pirin family protein [Pigmentiphaga sp.]|nr:pirin family protein [Pigmentiphaga sp.]
MSHPEPLEQILIPRTADLGNAFYVKRVLPSRERRMVGPYVFLDQMGPKTLAPGEGLDVRPHPHIGLATVTYLYDGEMIHRDSVGAVQAIQPGAVNWMTAGRGIAHSECSSPAQRAGDASLFGLQCWVALPREHEETDPRFDHLDPGLLPRINDGGMQATVLAGRFFGEQSPAPTFSPLFQVDVRLQAGARLEIPSLYAEQALYLVQGSIEISHQQFGPSQLLVMQAGQPLIIKALPGPEVVLMLLGGEPFDEPRYVQWNFVSSSIDRLEQAKEDWMHQRFQQIPDETGFIPLPPGLGRAAPR